MATCYVNTSILTYKCFHLNANMLNVSFAQLNMTQLNVVLNMNVYEKMSACLQSGV